MVNEKLEKIKAEYSIPPEHILSVSALNSYLSNKFRMDEKLETIYLLGEVSNLRCSSKNHLFFDMKDDQSKISCVIFDNSQDQTEFLKDGKEVLIRGWVDFYKREGKASIKPDKIYPIGEGLLSQKLKKLMKKLRGEGLFKEEHKKPLPKIPDKIGIITSQSSDALRDIVSSIHAKHPKIDIYVHHADVQGQDAASQLSKGICFFDEDFPVDVIIMGRGGGSMEDLMAFNDETLARTIYAAKTPIITGIGHHENEIVADYTADYKAITPTAAGKQAVPERKELQQNLDRLQRQTQTSYERFLTIKKQEQEIDQGKRMELKYKIAILVLIIVIGWLLVKVIF